MNRVENIYITFCPMLLFSWNYHNINIVVYDKFLKTMALLNFGLDGK